MAYRTVPDATKVAYSANFAEPEQVVATVASDGTGQFSTIDAARSYIRSAGLLNNMTSNLVVNVTGTFRVTSPIHFDGGDSGTNGYRVIYRNTGSAGSSRVLGSRVVTGWAVYSGSIYRAQVGAGLSIHTMWENGTRARKARSPKLTLDGTHPTALATYRTSENAVAGSHTLLQYAAGDYSPGAWSLTDAQVYIWSGGNIAWFSDTIPISSLNLGARRFTLSQNSRYGNDSCRYYVQGVLDLLTEAGEYHYDSTSGYLYYWPTTSIATATIEIPVVTRIFEFVGASEIDRAKYIELSGLSIEQSNWTSFYRFAQVNDGDSGEGHFYPQYDRVKALASARTGMVYMTNADHIRIDRCHLKNSGYSAVFCNDYNQSHRFTNSWIEHAGHAGIYIDGKYPSEGDVSKSNMISNCKINDVGELSGEGACVQMFNSGSNLINGCEFARGPRMAVFLGAYTDLTPADVYSRNNRIQYVYAHDLCQDSGDVGVIGMFGLSSKASPAPQLTNYINQVRIDNASAHASMLDLAPVGVFLDNQTYAQDVRNVQVTNVPGGQAKFAVDSAEHTIVNCSWAGGFDASLIDTANIGVTASWPYA